MGRLGLMESCMGRPHNLFHIVSMEWRGPRGGGAAAHNPGWVGGWLVGSVARRDQSQMEIRTEFHASIRKEINAVDRHHPFPTLHPLTHPSTSISFSFSEQQLSQFL